MSTLPNFQKDVLGTSSSNAYPEYPEYRVCIEQIGDGTKFQMWAEDTSGNIIGEYTFDEEVAEDGIIAMAQINHGLDGYEDDWHLPDGMYRTIQWALPGLPVDVDIRLGEPDIDEVAAWLRFALGLDEYTGDPENWEF
jgi:hypothetical protein